MHEVIWELKFSSVRAMAKLLFLNSNENLSIPLHTHYEALPVVGRDIDDELRGGWDDDLVDNDLPEVFHDWLSTGYVMEEHPDWTPPQLMAAYAFYLVHDAARILKEIAPEDEKWNDYGWRRDETIEHCAANVIAALECVHYGRLLLGLKLVPDPARLADLIKQHESKKGKKGAAEKLANDPKQHAKVDVYKRWQAWQAGTESYEGQAAFARAMLAEWSNVLKSQPSIEAWCRQWRRNENIPLIEPA